MIVGGSMVIAALSTLLVRQRVQKPSGESHNEVAGFIFATGGVLYAVLLALMVFAVWEGYGPADHATSQEAAAVLALGRYSGTLPEPVRAETHDALQAYGEIVLTNEWKHMTEAAGGAPDKVIAHRWTSYAKLQPVSDYSDAATLLTDLSTSRTQRILAGQAEIPSRFWVILVGGGLITLIFCDVRVTRRHRRALPVADL